MGRINILGPRTAQSLDLLESTVHGAASHQVTAAKTSGHQCSRSSRGQEVADWVTSSLWSVGGASCAAVSHQGSKVKGHHRGHRAALTVLSAGAVGHQGSKVKGHHRVHWAALAVLSAAVVSR